MSELKAGSAGHENRRNSLSREFRERSHASQPAAPPSAATPSLPRDKGELAIVLHSHMPYVEGFGTWPFGEEWLFEAIATSYVPLIELCERWAADGDRDVITVGVTPVLADQLAMPAVGDRFLRFVRGVREETHKLDIQGLESSGQQDAAEGLRRSWARYERSTRTFDRLGGDLIGALRRLREAGSIELWASAASHAVLPLLATELGVRLQVSTGIDSHRERFGHWSGGFWLPECAYRPGLEEQLAAAGVRCFCVYRHHTDGLGTQRPVAAAGTVAIPIDWDVIALVWGDRGYPADGAYRDYHAITANGLRAWANSGGPYAAEPALARARDHARAFVASVSRRLEHQLYECGRPGLVVCALDTELLGHWWHEGPAWLEAVVQEAHETGLALATLPEALERHEPCDAELLETSWGAGKTLDTWDSPAVADLVWDARRAELQLVDAVTRLDGLDSRRALERSARELLALQASDWAFMETRALAADYPIQRVRGHAGAFQQALAALPGRVTDSGHVPNACDTSIEPGLRGLAPGLRVSTLLEPSSAWGRPG